MILVQIYFTANIFLYGVYHGQEGWEYKEISLNVLMALLLLGFGVVLWGYDNLLIFIKWFSESSQIRTFYKICFTKELDDLTADQIKKLHGFKQLNGGLKAYLNNKAIDIILKKNNKKKTDIL